MNLQKIEGNIIVEVVDEVLKDIFLLDDRCHRIFNIINNNTVNNIKYRVRDEVSLSWIDVIENEASKKVKNTYIRMKMSEHTENI